MSYPAYVTGRITITPPLAHADLSEHPSLMTPDGVVAQGRQARCRQAWVDTSETSVETEQGTLISRTGGEIEAYDDTESPRWLEEDVQEIVSAWPDRKYGGYLELHFTDGLERIIVRDGTAKTIQPVLTWVMEEE